MGAVAAILVALGIIGLIYGLMQKSKAGRMTKVPFAGTGDVASKGKEVANEKGAVSTEGTVQCPQPLESPVTGAPCLYYEVKVTAKWKDGETDKSKTLQQDKMAASFAVDDGTGAVSIDASEGGDFDEMEKSYDQTKKTGLIGGIKGDDLEFGNLRVSTGALKLGARYTVEERILKPSEKLYVLGAVAEGGGIGAPKWRSLILSGKGREALLESAMKQAKMFLIGGAAAAGVGIILGIISQVIA